VIVAAEEQNDARMAVAELGRVARPLAEAYGTQMLGPAPAPIERVRKHWRFHALFKNPSVSKLQAFMHSLRGGLNFGNKIRVIFDLDPQDML